MEFYFRVRLSDVSAQRLSSPYRTPQSLPFFRLDFDRKRIQSELCAAPGDPSWSYKLVFEYHLVENTLADAIASLATRFATMEIVFSDPTPRGDREVVAGKASVDLLTVATGAPDFHLDLMDDEGRNTGRVSFKLAMNQNTVVSLQLGRLSLMGIPSSIPVRLSFFMLGAESNEEYGPVASATANPTWEELPKLLVRTTLKQLLQDTMRVCLRDPQNRMLGRFDLPFEGLIQSNSDHSVSFTRNMYGEGGHSFTALAKGFLYISDLPIFSQFVSGKNVNNVVSGKPVLPSCPLPPKMAQGVAPLHFSGSHNPERVVSPERSRTGTIASVASRGFEVVQQQKSERYLQPVQQPTPGYATHQPPPPPPPSMPMPMPQLPRQSTQGLGDVQSTLLRQHDEAVAAIEAQRRRTEHLSQELALRHDTETKQHRDALMALDSEEKRLIYELQQVEIRIKELSGHKDELEQMHDQNIKALTMDQTTFANELDELNAASAQLNSMLQNIAQHAQEDEEIRRRARMEVENARNCLQNDVRNFSDVESTLVSRSQQSVFPAAASSTFLAQPARYNTTSQQSQQFSSSGVEHHQSHQTLLSSSILPQQSAATQSATARSPLPPQAEHEHPIIEAIKMSDAGQVRRYLQSQPELVLTTNSLLHIACAVPTPNFDIVSMLASARKELVTAVDATSGNTPLHFACAARKPSVEVVDVLLALGADSSIFNKDGLTPFHLALLNTNDTGNRIRRYLLLKGPVSINCSTAQGESPVHLCATKNSNLDAVKFLVSHGAVTDSVALVRDGSHSAKPMTPLEKAELYGASDIVLYLKNLF